MSSPRPETRCRPWSQLTPRANLTWRGRYNVYGRMRAYLDPLRKGEGVETIPDFDHWKETRTETREEGTLADNASVWKSPQPLQNLIIDQDNPTQAFQLASSFLKTSAFGARQGPHNAAPA